MARPRRAQKHAARKHAAGRKSAPKRVPLPDPRHVRAAVLSAKRKPVISLTTAQKLGEAAAVLATIAAGAFGASKLLDSGIDLSAKNRQLGKIEPALSRMANVTSHIRRIGSNTAKLVGQIEQQE